MITVVGGTYDEICFEPNWNAKFGSGLRACWVINTLSDSEDIEFYTFSDTKTEAYFNLLANIFSSLKTTVTHITSSIQFYYDHPLIEPRIFPRLDTIDKTENNIKITGDNILYYGFIEGNASIKGKKVVYDPQSPIKPLSFLETGSSAEELVYVINLREAEFLSRKKDIQDIINHFFNIEKASILVLKMGPKGALVATSNGQQKLIPVYKTNKVWTIGSGDIFAAAFAFHWFNTNDPVYAAEQASWQTACYSNSKSFEFSEINSNPDIVPLTIENIPTKQVYLAGPFFTFSERWLVDQIYKSLKSFGLKVFSPWHHVGLGVASEVVLKDLEALNHSSIVLAVLDGLDSGTLFEIGYAVKMGIPVIGYVENESSESIKMLEGTNCILEKDLATAIYKCFWKIAENE